MKPAKDLLIYETRPRFPEDKYRRISRNATALGLSVSAYIRLLVDIALEEESQIKERIRRAS